MCMSAFVAGMCVADVPCKETNGMANAKIGLDGDARLLSYVPSLLART